MSCPLEMLEELHQYAEEHPSFDTEFIESVSEAVDEYGDLTYGQATAVENIHEKFRVRAWIDENK